MRGITIDEIKELIDAADAKHKDLTLEIDTEGNVDIAFDTPTTLYGTTSTKPFYQTDNRHFEPKKSTRRQNNNNEK